MLNEVRGIGKYARKGVLQIADPVKRTTVTGRYRAAREKLVEFEEKVKLMVCSQLGVDVLCYQRLMNFARRIYGLARKSEGNLLMAQVARDGGDWMGRALKPEHVLEVAVKSLEVLGTQLPGKEKQKLARAMKDWADRKVAEKPEPVRKPVVPVRRKRIELSEVEKATAFEEFTRTRATGQLRDALAMQLPVVRHCVARRLCEHASYDDLAEELDLTRGQVAGILEKVRPWGHRFTTYFEDDWYWVDGAGPVVKTSSFLTPALSCKGRG